MATQTKVTSKSNIPMVPVIAAVLAVLLGIAYFTTRGSSETADPDAGPIVAGEPLPEHQNESPDQDPAVGMVAPNTVGQDFDGEPINFTRNHRPKMLVFLAHWCSHCQAEVPQLVEWINAGGVPGDLQVVAISTMESPTRPNYPAQAWLEREGWPADVLVDDGESSVAEAYGLTGTPYFVFLDDEDHVVARFSGEMPIDAVAQIATAVAGG